MELEELRFDSPVTIYFHPVMCSPDNTKSNFKWAFFFYFNTGRCFSCEIYACRLCVPTQSNTDIELANIDGNESVIWGTHWKDGKKRKT